MNDVEAIKRGVAPVQKELTNSDTPYTVPSNVTASALNVYNPSSTDLVITLTHDSDTVPTTTTTLTVPANTTWADQVKFFTNLATSGSTDFKIQVKGWAKNDQ